MSVSVACEPVWALSPAHSSSSDAAPVDSVTGDGLSSAVDEVNDGVACDGPRCLARGGKVPLWRYHCRSCADRLVNYNLCPDCHASRRRAILSLAAGSSLPAAYHDQEHEFAYLYNRYRMLTKRGTRTAADILRDSALCASDFSPTAPSQLCRPMVRLMYLIGVALNELAALVNYEQWSAVQQRVTPQIDLAHFYHHSRDHEYLVLLYWNSSSLLDQVGGGDDRTLGEHFFALSTLSELASLPDDQSSQMLLIHLKEAVLHATGQRVHVQVSTFDFEYAGLLIAAMSEMRTVFARPELKDVLALITDRSHSYWPHYTQLNNFIMHAIDSQPPELGLQMALFRVLSRCGLPRIAGVEQQPGDTDVTQLVGEHLFHLHLIAQQYHLVCKWRMCRLQLAFHCQSVLKLLVPRLSAQGLVGLSEAQLELVRFLDFAYRALRPRQPHLRFEHDRRVVLDVVGSGMGSSSRLLLFIQQLLGARSMAAATPAQAAASPELRDALIQLVALFIFVLRGGADEAPEQVLADSVRRALPAERDELAAVVTLSERWTPLSSASAEVIRVLGGDTKLTTAVPGGWDFPSLPNLFQDRLPRSLRPAADPPAGWTTVQWTTPPSISAPPHRETKARAKRSLWQQLHAANSSNNELLGRLDQRKLLSSTSPTTDSHEDTYNSAYDDYDDTNRPSAAGTFAVTVTGHNHHAQSAFAVTPSGSSLPLGLIPWSDLELSDPPFVLGAGGCGRVVLARWKSRHELVAVKQLHSAGMMGAGPVEHVQFLRAFHREVGLMYHLKGEPRVVSMRGACLEPGHECIVMEYLSSGSLFDFLHTKDGRAMQWVERTRLAFEAVQAINYLHLHSLGPIHHADIKSLNFLLDLNYSLKVADFGLSRVKQALNTLAARPSEPAGTVQWTAPELHASVDRPAYTAACDMFSLGVVLWEIATNDEPWKDDDKDQIAGWVLHQKLRLHIPDSVPSYFRQWIEDCWQHEPSSRPTCAQLLESMQQHMPRRDSTSTAAGASAMAAGRSSAMWPNEQLQLTDAGDSERVLEDTSERSGFEDRLQAARVATF